jgi:chromosome segregation ATPase
MAEITTAAVPEVSTELSTQSTPAPKKPEPSVRTLKAQIKKLEAELTDKDLEIQAATDKAVIFQKQAGELRDALRSIDAERNNLLATIRGALVNTVNMLDLLGGK